MNIIIGLVVITVMLWIISNQIGHNRDLLKEILDKLNEKK